MLMKKITYLILGLLLLITSGCFNTEKAANNSVNTKVVSVTDFTIGDFQDALEVASEKACSSVVAIVESGHFGVFPESTYKDDFVQTCHSVVFLSV